MKTLPGTILLIVALAAQLPHLNAAPANRNQLQAMIASSKLMELAEAMFCLLPRQVSLQSEKTGRGFVTDGCSEDFLTLNSQLQNIQRYKEDFDIKVSCRTNTQTDGGQFKPCTYVILKRNYYPYHEVYVTLCDFSDEHVDGKHTAACN